MTASDVLQPGLADTVHDGQQIFRAAMNAFANPGSIHDIPRAPTPPAPLSPAASALILTLADHETEIWLDHGLASSPSVLNFIRFHTGATIVDDPKRAAFAVVSEASNMPALEDLSLGTLEYPDRSTTVILQVSDLSADHGWQLSGPGIDGSVQLSITGAPSDLEMTLARNRALFPRGIDMLLVSRTCLAALPRTTLVRK